VYEEVESDPIIVPARELGTNIQRSKIFKPEVQSARLKDSKSKQQAAGVSKLSYDQVIESAVVAAHSFQDSCHKRLHVDVSDDETASTHTSAAATTSSTAASVDASITADLVPILSPMEVVVEANSVNVSHTSSLNDDAHTDTQTDVHTDDTGDDSMSDGVADGTNTDAQGSNAANANVIKSKQREAASGGSSNRSSRSQGNILDPNEPVFTGTKTYYPEFIMWQVP
jgi:hypothetical protein